MWQIVSQRPVPRNKQSDGTGKVENFKHWPNGMSESLWKSTFPNGNSGYGVQSLHEKYVGSKDNSMLKSTGKPFYIGVVSLLDGQVEHTVPYHHAEAHNFHHSMYLPVNDRLRVDDDKSAIFWMARGKPTSWSHLPAPIHRSIMDQVADIEHESNKPSGQSSKAPQFEPPRPPRSWSRAGSWKTIERG